jgi:hypothetical protein
MNMKQMVLNNMVPMGQKIARQADPNYHSYEQQGRAKEYQIELEACRKAYKEIQNGGNILQILTCLEKEVRSEANRISLIISAVNHNLSRYWAVNSETLLIEFQSSH